MPSKLHDLNNDIQASIELSATRLAESPRICEFCKRKYAKYSCPRCGLLYCSLDCYRSKDHRDCSSTFYHESRRAASASFVKDKESELTNDEKKKLLEIIHEYEVEAELNPLGEYTVLDDDDTPQADLDTKLEHTNTSDEESDTEERRKDLESRMNDIDIESADFYDLWKRLTIREQADFIRLTQEHENQSNGVL
ncbi:hypothetical protein V1514DRAFT_336388 [Lipomyces japonicus]|uniref:uncharacterized protein n=1 Tax=Lipomyces japonicus TaxID=56871 RepID=UPI0034CFDAF1